MGLFDFFKSKKEPAVTARPIEETETTTKTLVQSNKVNLVKEREQKVKYLLTKKNISDLTSEVKFVVDISGSMDHLYTSGQVAEIIERIFPVALALDDNKEMEVKLFNEQCKDFTTVTEDNLSNYRMILGNPTYGGTNYAPAIEAITKEAKQGLYKFPVLVVFITDGDNWDKAKTKQALYEASKYPIFFKFIGIGSGSDFEFLKELDDLTDRKFDNADFQEIKDLKNISDEKLYESLINEYSTVYPKIK